MARLAIATWVGPTPNQSGPMQEQRGLVLHIMQGSYEGSISWGKNPASSVSFHFATAKDGRLGQLVDTDVTAWTQGNGNGHWISVENEGYSGEALTDAQVENCAQLYAWGVQAHGWPLQTTDSPNGYGLGWHGMGGAGWGGHYDCPGEPIKAQRGQILARAQQILAGTEEEDPVAFLARDTQNRLVIITDDWNGWYRPPQADAAATQTAINDRAYWRKQMKLPAEVWINEGNTTQAKFNFGDARTNGLFGPDLGAVATGGAAVDYARIEDIVDQELDEQSRAGADAD